MRDKTLESKIEDLVLKEEVNEDDSVFTGESYNVAGLNFITAPLKAAKAAKALAKQKKIEQKEAAQKLKEKIQEESIQPQTNDPVPIKEKTEQEVKKEIEIATEEKAEPKDFSDSIPDKMEMPGVEQPSRSSIKKKVKDLEIETKTVDEILDAIQAERMGGPIVGSPKTGKPINFDKLLIGDADAVAAAFTKNIEYKKININNFVEDTKKLAVEYGFQKEGIEFLEKRLRAGDEYALGQAASLQMLPNSFAYTNTLSKKLLQNPDDENLHFEFETAAYWTAQNAKYAKGFSSTTGQLMAMRKINQQPLTIADIKKLSKDPKQKEKLRTLAKMLHNVGTDANRSKLLEVGGFYQWSKKAMMSTYISGLLSFTGTHAINFSSQSFFALLHFGERLGAAATGLLSKNRDKIYFGEVTAMMAGVRASLVDSLILFGKAMKTNESAYEKSLMKDRKLSDTETAQKYGVVSNRNLRAEDYGFSGITANALNFYSNVASVLGSRLLISADDFFKGILYRMELHALAYRKAAMREKELLDRGVAPQKAYDDAIAYQVDLINNPTDEISFEAQEFAKIGTFQNELKGAMKKVSEAVNKSVLLKAAAPFIDTPTNIISQTLQRSPFAFLARQWREDMEAGGARRQLALTRWGIGWGIMFGLQELVTSGRLVGKGPGDTELRATMRRDNVQPYTVRFMKEEGYTEKFLEFLDKIAEETGVNYSINEKDKAIYMPIRYFEPLSGVIAMAIDYHEYALYEPDKDKVSQVLLGAIAGLYNYSTQHPFLSLIGDMFETLGSYVPHRDVLLENLINKTVKTGATYAYLGSVGVMSSMQAGINRQLIDPLQRDWSVSPDTAPGIKGFYEAFNYIRSRTPGLSQTLPPLLDVFGRLKYSKNRVKPALGWLGIRLSVDRESTIDKMFRVNGIGLKDPRHIIIRDTRSGGGPRESGQRLYLSPRQKVEFIMIMNTVEIPTLVGKRKTQDLNFKQALLHVMRSKPFTDLDMGDIEEKRALIQDVYRTYYNMASQKMWEVDPSLTEELDKRIDEVEKEANKLPPSAARGFVKQGDERKAINKKIDQMKEN